MADDFNRRMFLWMDEVAANRDLAPAALRVAWVLRSVWINKNRGDAFPAIETVSAALGVSGNSVRTALQSLVAHGHLAINFQSSGGRGRPSVYRVTWKGGDPFKAWREKRTFEGRAIPSSKSRGFDVPEPSDLLEGVKTETLKSDLGNPQVGPRKPSSRSETNLKENLKGNLERGTQAQSPSDLQSKKKGTARPSTTWPASFTLDEGMREFAASKGFSDSYVDTIFEKFRAHAETHDRRCKNWRAAWQQWVLHERQPAPSAGPLFAGAPRAAATPISNLERRHFSQRGGT